MCHASEIQEESWSLVLIRDSADLSSSVLDDVTSEDGTEIRVTHRDTHIYIYACAHIRIERRERVESMPSVNFNRVRSMFLRKQKANV